MTVPADPTEPTPPREDADLPEDEATEEALASALSPAARRALRATESWLQEWIVGLGLCPFAAPAIARKHLRIAVSEEAQLESRLHDFARELQAVMDTSRPHRTTLLVYADPDMSLDDFLGLLSVADVLVANEGLEYMVQLVGFHPHQRYADGHATDAAAFATRAPYPVIHILLEVDVEEAVAEHPDVAGVPDRNARTLEGLGTTVLARQLAAWRRGAS